MIVETNAQQQSQFPNGPALIARHNALVRGAFDLTAHQTRYTREHFEPVPGYTIFTEKFQRSPNTLVQKATVFDGSLLYLNGYDGSVAWEFRDDVARILTGPEAEVLESAAAMLDPKLLEPVGENVASGMVTVAEIGEGDDAVFVLTQGGQTLAECEAAGFNIIRVSKSTGLLASTSIGGGRMPWFVRQTFGKYRDFGGLLIATELTTLSRTGAVDFKHAVTIDDVRWDCVSDQQLEPPPAVQKLLNS